jgi:hypothetical protein
MTAEKLLRKAAAVVRDRRHTCGQPLDLFECVHDPRHLDSIVDIGVMPAAWPRCLSAAIGTAFPSSPRRIRASGGQNATRSASSAPSSTARGGMRRMADSPALVRLS